MLLCLCTRALTKIEPSIRRSAGEVILEGSPPLYMPPGTSVILATLLMQRSQDEWGEDAEQFKPERWLGSADGSSRHDLPGFAPFSAGPRTVCRSARSVVGSHTDAATHPQCLGRGFALMQISYFLVQFVQAISARDLVLTLGTNDIPPTWQLLKGRAREEEAWVVSNLTMQIKGGLWIRFREAIDT
jgi:hypothetical protein